MMRKVLVAVEAVRLISAALCLCTVGDHKPGIKKTAGCCALSGRSVTDALPCHAEFAESQNFCPAFTGNAIVQDCTKTLNTSA